MRANECLIGLAVCSFGLSACEDKQTEWVHHALIDGGTVLDASAAGPDASVGTSAENCTRRTLCKDGIRIDVDGLCSRELYGKSDGVASAGLYHVCIVDPSGTLYTSVWRGDVIVTSPGWTHSPWSNGLVSSTLSASDEARCTAAKAARDDAGTPGSFASCHP